MPQSISPVQALLRGSTPDQRTLRPFGRVLFSSTPGCRAHTGLPPPILPLGDLWIDLSSPGWLSIFHKVQWPRLYRLHNSQARKMVHLLLLPRRICHIRQIILEFRHCPRLHLQYRYLSSIQHQGSCKRRYLTRRDLMPQKAQGDAAVRVWPSSHLGTPCSHDELTDSRRHFLARARPWIPGMESELTM